MQSLRPRTYWPSLIAHIRDVNKWSQWQFASEVPSNHETVSRWERSLVLPSRAKQALIEKIAERLHLWSLNGIAKIVRLSPFPMLLCDRRDSIVAASLSSGLGEDETVLPQCPVDQHAHYRTFTRLLMSDGFWHESGQSRLYRFHSRAGDVLSAVVVSINVRGELYCVAQARPVEHEKSHARGVGNPGLAVVHAAKRQDPGNVQPRNPMDRANGER